MTDDSGSDAEPMSKR